MPNAAKANCEVRPASLLAASWVSIVLQVQPYSAGTVKRAVLNDKEYYRVPTKVANQWWPTAVGPRSTVLQHIATEEPSHMCTNPLAQFPGIMSRHSIQCVIVKELERTEPCRPARVYVRGALNMPQCKTH